MTPAQPDIGHRVSRAKHSIRRAAERYGFDFDRRQLAEFRRRILERIDQGDDPESGCLLLSRQSASVSRWALWHGGEWLPMVYDEEMAALVTILPPEFLRRHKGKLPW